MKLKIIALLAVLPLLLVPMCCITPEGEVDWVAISQGVDLAAQDVDALADLSIADDIRPELNEIAYWLAAAAPLLAQGEGEGGASEALDSAYAACEALLEREDLEDRVRDILVVAKIAINHARVYVPS